MSATSEHPIFDAVVKVFLLKQYALFLSCWCAAFAVHAQDTWSLQKAIAYAQEHNLTIKQSQVNTELSNATYLQSKLNLLPNLNGSANYGVNKGKNIDPTSNQFTNQSIQSGQASLSSSVVLFGGFTKLNEIKSNYYSYMSARYATQQSVNDISLAVANAYLQVLYANELLQQSTENLTIAQSQQKRMQALVTAGSAAEGQLFEIDALVASQELNQVTADNQRSLALLNLQQLLDLDKPIAVEQPSVELPADASRLTSADSIYDISVKTYPAVLSAQYGLSAAEKGFAAARGRRYPTLSLFANLSTNYANSVKRILSVDTTGNLLPVGYVVGSNDLVVAPEFNYNFEKTPFGDQIKDNFGQAIGLSLQIPLFNGWGTNTAVKQSQLQMISSQINYETQRNNLLKDIRTAHADATAAYNKLQAATRQQTSAQRAFDYAQQRLNAGAIASLDYDQAVRNRNAAQSDLLQAKYDYIFKLKVLDYYQGKPLTLP